MDNEETKVWLRENLKDLIDEISGKQELLKFCVEVLYRIEHDVPWSKNLCQGWKSMGKELGFTL